MREGRFGHGVPRHSERRKCIEDAVKAADNQRLATAGHSSNSDIVRLSEGSPEWDCQGPAPSGRTIVGAR
eukprot:9033135-Lingulodinium_polyedra.AAC.1